jgi:hypothetical protein
VVEIGAATNFLVDQLLMTRAGENVLALMTATVPVMNADTCTAALISLFEGAQVSLDNIPGLNQLRAIRADLAPLARKIGFGEKVLNYDKFLLSLRADDSTASTNDPYFTIPVASDIASIIQQLHRVVTNEDDFIFICRGLRGAAWITAYAGDVLGLPVCALQANRTSVPITGAYDEAKVLIELASEKTECGLYLKKEVQEQFQPQGLGANNRRGWSVDCGVVDSPEYHYSRISALQVREIMSIFAALELSIKYLESVVQFQPG